MPRLLVPDTYHPILQFRYWVTTSKLPGSQFYAKSAAQPTAQHTPVTVEYVNSYFKVKGKTRWDSITLSCYQFEGITAPELWAYLQQHQATESATDSRAPGYKHDLQLMLLGPDEVPIGTWKLVGAFISNAEFGDFNWNTSDPVEITLTITYDYAILEF